MITVLTDQRNQTVTSAITQYSQRLFKFIRGRVSSNADAEDILQDVWYQFSKVVGIEPIEQVSGWLFRVARNRVTDSYRKKRPALLNDLGNDDGDESDWLQEILLADDADPELEMLKEVFWEALFEALDELPSNQKEVFVWNELEDQTFQEISDRTGINLKTLISRKRYAVIHLRKRLQNLYDDFFKLLNQSLCQSMYQDMSREYIKNRMGRKVARAVFMLAALSLFILTAGFVVKFLWNALLPDLFDLKRISFLQAVGLLVLSRILFGGFNWHKKGRKWSSSHGRSQWRNKWSNMTEEDRKAFKAKWRSRCK